MPRSLCLLILLAACGKSGPTERERAACHAVCEHMFELTLADIDHSIAAMPDPALGAGLKARATAARDSDIATCEPACLAGKIRGQCALDARTLDAAMACTRK